MQYVADILPALFSPFLLPRALRSSLGHRDVLYQDGGVQEPGVWWSAYAVVLWPMNGSHPLRDEEQWKAVHVFGIQGPSKSP